MWQNGMLDIRNRNLATTHSLSDTDDLGFDDLEWFGYDPNAQNNNFPGATENELAQVNVENVLNHHADLLGYLGMQHFNLVRESESFGVDIYLEVLQVCQNLLNQNL